MWPCQIDIITWQSWVKVEVIFFSRRHSGWSASGSVFSATGEMNLALLTLSNCPQSSSCVEPWIWTSFGFPDGHLLESQHSQIRSALQKRAALAPATRSTARTLNWPSPHEKSNTFTAQFRWGTSKSLCKPSVTEAIKALLTQEWQTSNTRCPSCCRNTCRIEASTRLITSYRGFQTNLTCYKVIQIYTNIKWSLGIFRNLTSDYTESCRRKPVNQEMWSRRCDTVEMYEIRFWRVGIARNAVFSIVCGFAGSESQLLKRELLRISCWRCRQKLQSFPWLLPPLPFWPAFLPFHGHGVGHSSVHGWFHWPFQPLFAMSGRGLP